MSELAHMYDVYLKIKELGSSTSSNVDTPTSTPSETAEVAGMHCGFKNLYAGAEDEHGRYKWLDTLPDDVGKPAEDAESAKYALIVRRVKVFNDPRRVLKLHSVVVQSPLLRELLGKVLKGYPGVTTALQRLTFSGKFEPLIHRWVELGKAISDEENTTTKEHAQLLYGILEKEFKETIDEYLDLKANRVASFELLFALFQPRALVFSRQDGQDAIYKAINNDYGRDRHGNNVYWLNCQYVDWDGSKFGTRKINLMIPEFSGTVPLSQLAVYPLEFHPKSDETRIRLLERGSKFEKLAGSHYKAYNGIGWQSGMFGKEKFNIKGRAMICASSWNRFNASQAVYITSLSQYNEVTPIKSMEADDESDNDDSDCDNDSRSYSGTGIDSEDGMPTDGAFPDDDDEDQKIMPLTEEQLIMCASTVRGYSFSNKKWLNFFVNSVKDIEWNTGAFDSLVLPANQKELILGFTESQRKLKSSFDDVIEGKGRGIILLLCGPPGVGKTLTAESVAEEMRAPLYMMSAGDLGLAAAEVEERLSNILEMCAKWNAVLLIDEADIFLEQRSLHELERNKLVTIFLRILEYYEGIMFLTTNRVQTFDAAFQSRIHISLDYPELTSESRRTIWCNFLRGLSTPNTLTDMHLDRLALVEMNGRQIKNAIKTALLLSSRKEEPLGYDHVKVVLDVTQHLHKMTRETDRQRSAIFA